MAELGKWDVDAWLMSDVELRKRIKAFDVLEAWPMFNSEYRWTGIFTNRQILKSVQEVRERAIAEGYEWMVVVNNIHKPVRFFNGKQEALNFVMSQGPEITTNALFQWNKKEWIRRN